MGMATGGSGGGRSSLSEINVTPFVDVMLVLLIIFIVAAPMLSQNEVDVDLPKTAAEPSEGDQEKLLLSVTKDRKVFLGEVEIPAEKMEEALAHNERLKEEGEVYVQADRTVPYGFVVRVFAAVRKAGVQKLGLVTNPSGGGVETGEEGGGEAGSE